MKPGQGGREGRSSADQDQDMTASYSGFNLFSSRLLLILVWTVAMRAAIANGLRRGIWETELEDWLGWPPSLHTR